MTLNGSHVNRDSSLRNAQQRIQITLKQHYTPVP